MATVGVKGLNSNITFFAG